MIATVGTKLKKMLFLILKNFVIFTEKHLSWSLFFNYVADLQVFSCEFCEIFKNTYFEKHLQTAASGLLLQNCAYVKKNTFCVNLMSGYVLN